MQVGEMILNTTCINAQLIKVTLVLFTTNGTKLYLIKNANHNISLITGALKYLYKRSVSINTGH